jgi:Phage derived protein Gp49-like (DUF891)
MTGRRILFVFDPWRSAILLVADDKAGSWNKWYAGMIPRADRLCEIYLKERAAEGRQPVTSYTKWDRDAYIERIGGPEEAERRQTLMARQSGQRLADERKQRGLTQAQLAQIIGVTLAGFPRSSAASCPPLRPSPVTSRPSAGA